MALKDLSPSQKAFLVLTSESGSPYHPFVASLRRLLKMTELVEDKTRNTKAGQIVEADASDIEVVLKHHLEEQGPLYTKRIEALEVLLDLGAKPAASPAKAKDASQK